MTGTSEQDIQAVRELADVAGAIPLNVFATLPPGLGAAINKLYGQFQDRIEARDTRDPTEKENT